MEAEFTRPPGADGSGREVPQHMLAGLGLLREAFDYANGLNKTFGSLRWKSLCCVAPA
jgi:hypothetical protein